MKPIVDGLEATYRDFEIVRLDVESGRGRSTAREMGIIGQPAFIFIDEAGEEVRRLQGAQTQETLEQEILRFAGE